jgi:RNA 2',3'-cyclic 3'-phosphodiesterase
VRLFVGVWPPPEVCRLLSGLERPTVPHLRWTTPRQWHVTLRFLGEQPEGEVEQLGAVLRSVAAEAHRPPEALAGPSVRLLGRSVLCVPVGGLQATADALDAALGHEAEGRGPSTSRRFRGHLTLARSRGDRPVPRSLAGAPIEARWTVRELCLISSSLEPGGARYTTVASATVPS